VGGEDFRELILHRPGEVVMHIQKKVRAAGTLFVQNHQKVFAAICRKKLRPGRDASAAAAMVVAQIRRTISNQTRSRKAMTSDLEVVISTLCDLPVLSDIGRCQIEPTVRTRRVGMKAALQRFITDAGGFL
jgi:hypothetical protein